jgi:beta-N-acetylhexosaminidase
MLKYIFQIIFIVILLITFPAKLSTDDFSDKADFPFPLNEVDELWVENTLRNMTLKERCAQLIVSSASSHDTAYDGKSYQRLKKLVNDFKVGGLIFFSGKLENQITLTNRLQELSSVPLIISADYERGPGMRLKDVISFPHNMALGATNDPQLTYLMGQYTAIVSRAIGVHMNFAPLLDVNNDYRNPVINIRAYAEDPNIISWHGNSFIRGMHDGGMISVAKHFPGHGATDLDSHLELPIINRTIEHLKNVDLVPFNEAIKSGVQAIMIGHLQVPAIEEQDGLPATFSSSIINTMLKKQMNFGGLVVTDAMNMKAVTDSFDVKEAAQLALLAGNDIILFPPDDSLAIEGLHELAMTDENALWRINESVRKILSAKKWLNLDSFTVIDKNAADSLVNHPKFKRLSNEIADKAITLIKDEKDLIPIDPRKYYQTSILTLSGTKNRSYIKEKKYFDELAEEKFDYTNDIRLNRSSKLKDYRNALRTAQKSDLIILNLFLTSYNNEDYVFIEPRQKKFIDELINLDKPLIIANFGNPYLYEEFRHTPNYICSFSWTNVAQKSMLNSILGYNSIGGKLPVTLPGTKHKIGTGIQKKVETLFVPDTLSDSSYNFTQIAKLVKKAISDSVFPGAQVVVGHRKRIVYNNSFGRQTYDSTSLPITSKSMYDLASVTKVAATTSAAMMLYDKGLLKLEQPVNEILPEFTGHDKEKITIKHLLVHNSGLPAFKRYYLKFDTREEIINDIMSTELIFEPGTDYTYSDLGMITLQMVIEKITNMPMDKFLDDNLFDFLDMQNTMFNPTPDKWFYCVPSELDDYWRHRLVKGKVHDENAHMLGGVAGHAGLFAPASDLAKLLFLYINEGQIKDSVIFNPETIELFTSSQTKFGDRGLGWDTKSVDGYSSAGSKFSPNSFGHTGFTGTSVWVDKDRALFVILLTNRVYPTRENRKIIQFRPKLHDAIIDAIDY